MSEEQGNAEKLARENEGLRRKLQDLSAALARHEALLASIPDIIVEVDVNKVYVWANQPGIAFFGSDVVGKEAAFYFEGAQDTYDRVRPLFRGDQQTFYVESWQRRRDGEKRLLAWWCRALKDEAGNVTGALSTGRDITEERSAAVEIYETGERFRAFFDDAPIAKAMTAPDGKLLRVNAALCCMLGYSAEELQRMTFAPITHPDDVAESVEAMRRLVAGEGDTWTTEKRYIAKDGRVVWAQLTTRIERGSGGMPLYLLTHLLDITERKRVQRDLEASEARYRRLFEAAQDGILILDADTGRVVDINPFLVTLTGYSREEIMGAHLWEIGLLKDVAASKDSFADLQSKRYVRYDDLPLETRDGRKIDVEFVSNVYRVDNQNVIQCNVRDISARKRAERELARLSQQLLASQKMEAVGGLAGGIAHDFNNLLSVILSYASFALEDVPEGDPLRDDLLEINGAAERAARLTAQLLAFGRKQVLRPAPLDLNLVVSEMDTMLRRIIGEDIALTQMPSANLGVVSADPSQIEQVIMNLVVNARDAMPEGGSLTIETSNVDLDEGYAAAHVEVKPGPYVLLAVTDTGCGMDERTRERIFEPFFTTKKPTKGTGLGLSTVYGIVKQSGGNITVYSEPGRGTTFKVYLPREIGAVAVTSGSPPSTAPAFGTETILVVEDEPALGAVAKRILGAAGYTVLVAENGGEALLISEGHDGEIHLVLTDVVMPQMSGKVLAGRLAMGRPKIKVLYMSGYADDAIVHHGVLDAGTNFIAKPFNAVDLARKVREVLDAGGDR